MRKIKYFLRFCWISPSSKSKMSLWSTISKYISRRRLNSKKKRQQKKESIIKLQQNGIQSVMAVNDIHVLVVSRVLMRATCVSPMYMNNFKQAHFK